MEDQNVGTENKRVLWVFIEIRFVTKQHIKLTRSSFVEHRHMHHYECTYLMLAQTVINKMRAPNKLQ